MGGEDIIELDNDMFAIINLSLRFLFLVLGESSLLKMRSSAEISRLALTSFSCSSASEAACSLEDCEVATESLKLSEAAALSHVRIL